MRFKRRIANVTAVQWKGWPSNIEGVLNHPTYPQLGYFQGEEMYVGYWIVTEGKEKSVWTDWDFKRTFKKI